MSQFTESDFWIELPVYCSEKGCSLHGVFLQEENSPFHLCTDSDTENHFIDIRKVSCYSRTYWLNKLACLKKTVKLLFSEVFGFLCLRIPMGHAVFKPEILRAPLSSHTVPSRNMSFFSESGNFISFELGLAGAFRIVS